MNYPVTIPSLVQKWLYPRFTWKKPSFENKVYLTFDDGPHPEITPFVLDTLAAYQAKATFFCIGKNVAAYPEIYKRIIRDGHATGNHTYNHLNGWRTADAEYLKNVREAAAVIDSNLFRPPYGRITRFQAKLLMEKMGYKIIMWTVLSGDFDENLPGERCLENVVKNTRPGSVVVFHDSEKAFKRLQFALPRTLEELSSRKNLLSELD